MPDSTAHINIFTLTQEMYIKSFSPIWIILYFNYSIGRQIYKSIQEETYDTCVNILQYQLGQLKFILYSF